MSWTCSSKSSAIAFECTIICEPPSSAELPARARGPRGVIASAPGTQRRGGEARVRARAAHLTAKVIGITYWLWRGVAPDLTARA